MKRSFKAQLWISFGVIFVAIVLATVGMYFFSNDLTAQADKIVADRTLIAQQTAVLGVLAELKHDAPRAAQYAVAMGTLLPKHDDLIGFSGWLNSIAQAHKVSSSFSFRGDNVSASPSSPGTDGFTISVQGSAENLVAFLKDLETQAPGFLLVVDSFDLSSTGTDYRTVLQGRLFSR